MSARLDDHGRRARGERLAVKEQPRSLRCPDPQPADAGLGARKLELVRRYPRVSLDTDHQKLERCHRISHPGGELPDVAGRERLALGAPKDPPALPRLVEAALCLGAIRRLDQLVALALPDRRRMRRAGAQQARHEEHHAAHRRESTASANVRSNPFDRLCQPPAREK
jgi:hypothetical protein